MAKGSIIIADDDAAIRLVLNQALTRAGYEVRVASNFSKLWEWIEAGEGDCVVSDVIMPDGDAFDVLPRIKHNRPDLPVILISAQNTFMTALNAQEVGAYEYLPKPFDLEKLVEAVNRAVLEPKDNRTTQTADEYTAKMPLVGRSQAMQEVYRSIARLTASDMAVMISGLSGTGKKLTARVLHDFGRRKHGPLITVNLSSIPEESVEDHLFGRQLVDGAIEHGILRKADGGTLYLEEVSGLPINVQSRLLRVLQTGEATPTGSTVPLKLDIRFISSTTQDLDHLINQGQFREDLYYRLNVVPIRLPALKDRREDIADLARHFLKMSEMEGAKAKFIENDTLSVLRDHLWPGNVREFENLIRRVAVLYPQETVTPAIIESEIRNGGFFRKSMMDASSGGFSGLKSATEYFVSRYFEEHGTSLPPDGVYDRFLQDFEHPLITSTLEATNGNQIRAAKLLGLNRNTLRKKIKQHGIRIVKTAK